MTHVRLLNSCPTDGDVAAHFALIEQLPRVRTFDEDPIRENRLPLIFASAFRMLRDRPVDCPIVTGGEPALIAASVTWRGPIVHMSSAPLSRLEASLLRRRRAWVTLLVTSSHTDARRAERSGVPRSAITVIRPFGPPTTSTGRDDARRALGLRDGQPTILIPGDIRRGSGHRLSLWAAGMLAARDPNTRLLMRSDPRRTADRFADATVSPGARLSTRGVDDRTLADAADVAIVTPDAAPRLAALFATAAAGTPIVSTRAFWTREQLEGVLPARLVDEIKPRLIARAALDAIESPRPLPSAVPGIESIRRQWLAVIHRVCGPALSTGNVA